MSDRKSSFRFQTRLSEIDALLIKTAIFLPEEVVNRLSGGRVRVEGTMNGAPFALAVQHKRDGSRFFSVGAPLRKLAGVKIGDKVDVVFKIVDPDALSLPEELEAALDQDDEARKVWDTFTTGYQRSLIHYVTSVRSVDSRIRRALDLLQTAKAGKLQGQRKPDI